MASFLFMDCIKSARLYVEYSNSKSLDLIFDMFAEDATYSSDGTGYYSNLAEIKKMMILFFDKHKNVYWQVDHYEKIDDFTVQFKFIRLNTEIKSVKTVPIYGDEKIEFNRHNLIKHIEVKIDE